MQISFYQGEGEVGNFCNILKFLMMRIIFFFKTRKNALGPFRFANYVGTLLRKVHGSTTYEL